MKKLNIYNTSTFSGDLLFEITNINIDDFSNENLLSIIENSIFI